MTSSSCVLLAIVLHTTLKLFIIHGTNCWHHSLYVPVIVSIFTASPVRVRERKSKCLLHCYIISHNYIFLCTVRFTTLNTQGSSITASSTCLRFSVFLLWGIIHSYELLVVPQADEMCGDSSLCCCQGKCQHVRSHFTSQMKRDPFLLLPHASQASCLKPRLCCLNGLREWPVLVLCVWATMVLWDICMLQSVIVTVCVFWQRKIPWKHPGVEIE